MYHFFVNTGQISGEMIRLSGPDVNHICHVLRMRPGEPILISDETGVDYACVLEELGQDSVWARITETCVDNHELTGKITLYQGLPKGDKMEWIIQKATELGAAAVAPVAMRRSVVRLDEKKAKGKTLRWQAVAESAAKQSKRSRIPQVEQPLSWGQALEQMSREDLLLVPYECAQGMKRTRELLSGIRPGRRIGILIGPEGGFAPEEIRDVTEIGGQVVTLGKRILRTETAGMAVLAMLALYLEE